MQLSVEPQSKANALAPPLLPADEELAGDVCQAPYDEFPGWTSSEYERMLQPVLQFKSELPVRLVAVIVAILLVAFSVVLVQKF